MTDLLLTAMIAVATAPAQGEPEITTKQLTQLQFAWLRFRRHKPAMAGVAFEARGLTWIDLKPFIADD